MNANVTIAPAALMATIVQTSGVVNWRLLSEPKSLAPSIAPGVASARETRSGKSTSQR